LELDKGPIKGVAYVYHLLNSMFWFQKT